MLPIRLPPLRSRLKAKLARWVQSCLDLYLEVRGHSRRPLLVARSHPPNKPLTQSRNREASPCWRTFLRRNGR